MISIKVRVIDTLRGGLFVDRRKVEFAIDETVDEVMNGVLEDALSVTETWDHRPSFKMKKTGKIGTLWTDDEVFNLLNSGTEEHPIVAVNAPKLVFKMGGFVPKTSVRSLISQEGRKATGRTFKGVEVWHPGTEAREWDEEIKKKWQHRVASIYKKNLESVM